MISDRRLRGLLAGSWGLRAATIEVHNGGMNSATWFVTEAGSRWVAKAVTPAARHAFTAGLAVATALEGTGFAAGAPVPTRLGEAVADVDGIPLALLTWVPGRELSGEDQHLIGATLARVHRALRDVSVPGAERFHWVDPRAEHLTSAPGSGAPSPPRSTPTTPSTREPCRGACCTPTRPRRPSGCTTTPEYAA